MPPYLALLLWSICLVLLLRFDPARNPKMSAALWIPVIALFIIGSRAPTQWLYGGVWVSAQSLEEGSPVDSAISLVLILSALGILTNRSFKWREFFARNVAFSMVIGFGLLSVLWSDFPFVAFKRWFRDIGNVVFILLVLSDPRPLEAVRTVLRRVCYLLIPLSILLDKYFPSYGRSFSVWTGQGYYQGAATSKNMLGVMCLIGGLFFLWDSIARWPNRKDKITRRILIVNGAFLALTLSLLRAAQSTTSSVCFVLGACVIIAAYSKPFRRHPGLLKLMIPMSFLFYLVVSFGLGMSGQLAQSVGKDPTMTDRTKIWAFLLSMHTNPMIGTGYQSFWLGSRLEYFWKNSGLGHINEAHNGYLGIYLEQGLVGLSLVVGFLISGYRLICKRFKKYHDLAALGFATWICLVFYNMSESAFGGGLLYLMFLIPAISMPLRVAERRQAEAGEFTIPPVMLQPFSSTEAHERR